MALVASLIDNSRGVIYNCKMFIVQATKGFTADAYVCLSAFFGLIPLVSFVTHPYHLM